MITLKHLRHLRAIIQHGTVLGAAEALHLTHPALTRSLNNLEEALGIQLFDRARTGMTPTVFCRQIAQRCEQLLLDVDDIQREAEIYRNIESGELHIAVGRAVKELIAREVLPEFVAQCPQVTVSISEGTPENLVYRTTHREVDLVLAGAGSYRGVKGLKYQRLKDIPISIITGPSHPLRGCKKVTLKQLAAYPLISPTLLSFTSPMHAVIADAVDSLPLTPSVVCSDYSALKAILLRNHSWLPTPELYFKEELSSGELCRLDFHHPATTIELSVIELNGRSRSPSAQVFIDICQNYFKSLII